MKHIILDTDPGVDDALAFLLLFNSPEVEVEAVTTVVGNVSQAKGHQNAKKLLGFLERTDVPVAEGAVKPLLRESLEAEWVHGATGLGDAVLPDPGFASYQVGAVELILEKTDELGDELNLLAVGPLTNIASAFLADPELPGRIGELVIMGGAYGLTPYGVGNMSPVAEYNIWQDPEAARIVFKSGVPLVCVGLDTTTHPDYRLSMEMYTRIQERGTTRSGLVEALCRSNMDRFNGLSLHDPMAAAYVIDPSLFRTEGHVVDVETMGQLTRGMTVVYRGRRRGDRAPNAEVVVDVDAPRFLDMIMERVVG